MSKKESVNYIKHLENMSEAFFDDKRLNPWHISMYYGLFHIWNRSKFRNPISISRSELMEIAKIGSANTYSKCLKQLHEWGYIKYSPSKNPMKGSKVYMYRNDTCSDTSTNTSSDTSAVHEVIHQVRPYLNTINNKKHNKPIKLGNRKTAFSPPQLSELKDFFLEIKSSTDQAEQFFNHFESNGWLVGGKAKMKDWKAASRNWVKRAQTFRTSNGFEKPIDRLHTNQDKDYSMPL